MNSTCTEQCFEANFSFRKSYICFIILGFKQKIWCFVSVPFSFLDNEPKGHFFLVKNCHQLHENCILPVQTKPLKENLFCGKSTSFMISDFWARKFLIIEGKVFNCIVDTAFYMSTERVKEKCSFKLFISFLILLGFERKEVGLLARFLAARLLELHSTCPKDHSRDEIFSDD